MPEYTYLLENRLSAAQLQTLAQVRDAAREAGMTVFLAGGAVRDLTTGSSVRDLDFAVQGNVLELQAALEAKGGTLWGKHEASRTLFFWFPGSVRIEVSSTRSETFPKPGQPVYTWSGIVDDLHRRDFTANAMALSLNEGSYGLLLDPLNGVADIEVRQLRLASNYGFLEDPARLIRAVRLRHRLGWQMEERTQTRYENAKEADNFDAISPFLRGYELEKIAAEDEAFGILKALEAEGWMSKLLPSWTSAAVDTGALEDLHRNRIQLLMQGISPDLSAAHLQVMTARMDAADRDALKAAMVRPGLLAQWEGLDAAAKEFSRLLTGKEAAQPSATWTLFHEHAAEAILWLAHTRKGAALETKFRNFFTVWPEAAKKVPVAMMLEMRITPELANYDELLHALFLQQIDGKLETDEQMRAFLEPYSPPAPPPPVTLRRSRSKKADSKGKRKTAAKDAEDEDEDEDDLDEERPASRSDDEDEEEDEDSDGEEPGLGRPAELGAPSKLNFDKVDLDAVLGRINDDSDDEDDEDSHEDEPAEIFAGSQSAGIGLKSDPDESDEGIGDAAEEDSPPSASPRSKGKASKAASGAAPTQAGAVSKGAVETKVSGSPGKRPKSEPAPLAAAPQKAGEPEAAPAPKAEEAAPPTGGVVAARLAALEASKNAEKKTGQPVPARGEASAKKQAASPIRETAKAPTKARSATIPDMGAATSKSVAGAIPKKTPAAAAKPEAVKAKAAPAAGKAGSGTGKVAAETHATAKPAMKAPAATPSKAGAKPAAKTPAKPNKKEAAKPAGKKR